MVVRKIGHTFAKTLGFGIAQVAFVESIEEVCDEVSGRNHGPGCRKVTYT